MISIALAMLVGQGYAQTFVDSSTAELAKALPELGHLDFDSDQSVIDPLLNATGQNLERMIARLMTVSIAEDVHEMRFDARSIVWDDLRENFSYVVQANPFAEVRKGGATKSSASAAKHGFLVAGNFLEMLADLLPDHRSQSRFRYLGRLTEGHAESFVVVFLKRDGSGQGLVWIDAATKRVLRLRTYILNPPKAQKVDAVIREVNYALVSFPASSMALWLPSKVTVEVRFAAGDLRSVHRFSAYQIVKRGGDIGIVTSGLAGTTDDRFEILLKGISSLQAGRSEEAVPLLHEAETQLPERFESAYYLGVALYKIHDLTGAETQFREAARRSPGAALAHNELASVLFERGNRSDALAEFQQAARLDPENAKVRANLETVVRAPASPAASDAIKVNVRQVLVPVVVTDVDGRHLTGLTQGDFHIFEDGIEQKITAFASERTDIPVLDHPGRGPNQAETAGAVPSQEGRYFYFICLDLLHTSFSNFVYVRDALQKLFQEEQAGNSQYAIVALGKKIDVVQDITSDRAKVLAAIGNATFQKKYQGETTWSQSDRASYESELNATRLACDAGSAACGARKMSLALRANGLEEQDRSRIQEFVAQLRALVEDSMRVNAHPTIVLISDGFLLAPGEFSRSLLGAYFPDLQPTVRAIERTEQSLDSILKLAAKGNVRICTIDSRGLYTPAGFNAARGGISPAVASSVNRQLSDIASDQGLTLSEIASATGGTAFRNSNDLLAGLKSAFADGREYYTLAYVSSKEELDGKFRKITVSLHENKAKVTAKRGYWATSE